MNREKKRIDGDVGRKEMKMDWGFYKNVCSSHNTDKKDKLNTEFEGFLFFFQNWAILFLLT